MKKALKWAFYFLAFFVTVGGIVTWLNKKTKDQYINIDEESDRYY